MRKNLVVAVAGDTSLHREWTRGDRTFDLHVVYYGDVEGKFAKDGEFYSNGKGTKFNVVASLERGFYEGYEHIFVPDDDLYMTSDQIDHLFQLADLYSLELCQPSLVGYYSLPITLHVPETILRFTNYVEIMSPCFSQQAFQKCFHTFDHNKSCWGIDMLWNHVLGNPEDKIAIVDDVVATHTRPCFKGDNYTNNNVENPINDVRAIVKEFSLSWDKVVYKKIEKEFDENTPHTERFHPPVPPNWLSFRTPFGTKLLASRSSGHLRLV